MISKYISIMTLFSIVGLVAKPAVSTKVAYMRLDKLQKESVEFEEQGKKIKYIINDLEKKAQRGQEIQAQLANENKRKVMSEEAQRKKEAEVNSIKYEIAQMQQEGMRLSQETEEEWREHVNEAAETVRKKGDWDAIEFVQIGGVSDRVDVTKEVIDELNKSYKASKKSDEEKGDKKS